VLAGAAVRLPVCVAPPVREELFTCTGLVSAYDMLSFSCVSWRPSVRNFSPVLPALLVDTSTRLHTFTARLSKIRYFKYLKLGILVPIHK
jgi:hypothetical protein